MAPHAGCSLPCAPRGPAGAALPGPSHAAVSVSLHVPDDPGELQRSQQLGARQRLAAHASRACGVMGNCACITSLAGPRVLIFLGLAAQVVDEPHA